MGLFDLFGIENDIIGKVGEKRIANKLNWIDIFGMKGQILQNVYIPRQDGNTSEIDVLYITKKGVFVIESKNYTGYIFGAEDQSKWTVTLNGGKNFFGTYKVEKHSFYNPIWQNKTHIKYLKSYIGTNIPMFSIIVFSDRCEFKNIVINSDNVIVCHRRDLSSAIRKNWKNNPDILTDDQVDKVYNHLKTLTNKSWVEKQEHVASIKDRFSSTTVCPRCGGKLVVRIAKNGKNIGKSFYGCSNYPKCKYTKPID